LQRGTTFAKGRCMQSTQRTSLLMMAAITWMGSGCGGDGEGDGGEDHVVTYDSLPQEDRDRFEAWKAQPLKACAWEQAFPALAEEYDQVLDGEPAPRVDHPALLLANSGSPLLAFGGGELVLLGEPVAELLWSNREYESSRSINGRKESFKISSNLDRGTCVVSLGGQELYRTSLPPAVPVVLSYDAAALAAPSVELLPLEDAPLGQPVARTDGNRLVRHALNALAPNARAHAALAARFQTTQARISALFPLSTQRQPGVARVLTPAGLAPFAPNAVAATALLGTRAQLEPLYSGASQVELLFSGGEGGRVALRVDLSSAPSGDGALVKATAISAAPLVPFDDAAMVACFEAREAARHFEPGVALAPAFAEQFLGCEALAADGYAALAASPELRVEIAQKAMSAIGPAYRGWDDGLIQIAQRVHQRGVDLAALGELGAVLPRWRTVRAAFAEDLSVRQALEQSLIATVFRWRFRALSPSEAFVLELRDALAATTATSAEFAASAQRMLEDLSTSLSPAGRGAAAMRCGQALTGARRGQIARSLDAAALVLYSQSFLEAFTGNFLQACPSDASVAALETSAAAVTSFLRADAERDGGSATFALSAAQVVEHALAQRWTAGTFTALADVLAFAAVSKHTPCGLSPAHAQQAVCVDSSFETLGASPGGLLAPPVMARNAELARTLKARWPELADAAFFTARFDLQDAYFGGMWLGCDDAGFARSRAKLLELIAALRRAATFNERFEIEAQLRELTGAATCA
jgi:hypothetical protein